MALVQLWLVLVHISECMWSRVFCVKMADNCVEATVAGSSCLRTCCSQARRRREGAQFGGQVAPSLRNCKSKVCLCERALSLATSHWPLSTHLLHALSLSLSFSSIPNWTNQIGNIPDISVANYIWRKLLILSLFGIKPPLIRDRLVPSS